MGKNGYGSILRRYSVLAGIFVLCMMIVGSVPARAEDDLQDEQWVHYVGVGTGRVNVRTGPGEQYDKLTDINGKTLQITAQEEVEIVGEKTNSSGKLWYNIRFVRDGIVYEGYSTSSYISKDDSRIITPTPVPTATPKPTASPTPLPPPTNTPTPPGPLVSDQTSTKAGRGREMLSLALILSAAFILALCFVIYTVINSHNNKKTSEAIRKAEKLRKLNSESEKAGRRVPVIRNIDESQPVAESDEDEGLQGDDDLFPSKQSTYREPEDKRALRLAIEQLREHDIVYHVIYGEGEVCDNSDVKLLEVRFGNDMRFLKKEQLIARKELKIPDPEEQEIERRRRR